MLSLHGGALARSAVTLSAAGARAAGDVPAGTALTLRLEALAPARGNQPLGRVTLSSVFPMGLWRGWAYVHFPLQGIVYPAAEIGAPPLPQGMTGQHAFASGRSEDADLTGLREFQRGDPPQRVAWKAVARGAGWFTKEFDGVGGGGGPVTLSWAALPDSLDNEARLSRLTAWVLAAERAARPFALNLPGTSLPGAQGPEHRHNALAALALFPQGSRA